MQKIPHGKILIRFSTALSLHSPGKFLKFSVALQSLFSHGDTGVILQALTKASKEMASLSSLLAGVLQKSMINYNSVTFKSTMIKTHF